MRRPSVAQNRQFAYGDRVRVAKKSRVVDKEREHENLSDEDKVPIDQDVTGLEGEVTGESYASTTKPGEYCVPIKLPNEAVIAVPEKRLERTFESRNIRSSLSDLPDRKIPRFMRKRKTKTSGKNKRKS